MKCAFKTTFAAAVFFLIITMAIPAQITSAVPSATTTGTINFHLLLGAGNAQDTLALDGGNFTDLIMSNIIAGVMYGHLVQEYSGIPGIQYNKDYMYGSLMAQFVAGKYCNSRLPVQQQSNRPFV